MVSSLPPPFERAKNSLRHARVDEQRSRPAAELAWDAMDATNAQEKFRLAQESLEYYPFCINAWGVVGYQYLEDETKNFEASIAAFQAGMDAARRVDPSLGPERTEDLYWSGMDIRPYFRVVSGLVRAYAESGQKELAIETVESSLVRRGCTRLNGRLAGWYLEAARWEDARRILLQSEQEDCEVAYTWLLLRYHDFSEQRGNEELDSKLYKALAHALEQNIYVPSLLANDNVEHREKPEEYSWGDESEALVYAIDHSNTWRRIPGALEWLLSTKERYGPKPSEEAFIQSLRRRSVYVEFSTRPSEMVTQNQEKMIGTALSSFRMRPECLQSHRNGSVIYAQKREFGMMPEDLWIEFRYDEVESVPFWSILATGIDEAEETKEVDETNENNRRERNRKRNNRKKRNRKKKAQTQQRMDKIWSELNAAHASTIASFLSLKEKAVVRSLNKVWLEGSTTLATKAEIDPKEVGLGVNGALRFVSSSFPRLQHFSLNIGQGYFLNLNDELWNDETESMGSLELHGSFLKRVFGQESIHLRSVKIGFDDCVQEHACRILCEEEGLSTLHRQVSLERLTLVYPYFESLRSLSLMIRPLVNLQRLRLFTPSFPDTEYKFNDVNELWQNPSELMSTIGSLPNLRALSIEDHRITDADLRNLSQLSELRELEINGQFGDAAFISLTDTAMTYIASTFRKLESLDVSYNRSITIKGYRDVIRSCPLRELQASEAGLTAQYLEEFVRAKPSLRFIRYGVGYMPTDQSILKKATIASQGRCVFMGNIDGPYEPKFDSKLMANHTATKKLIEEKDAEASNAYDG